MSMTTILAAFRVAPPDFIAFAYASRPSIEGDAGDEEALAAFVVLDRAGEERRRGAAVERVFGPRTSGEGRREKAVAVPHEERARTSELGGHLRLFK